MSKPILDEKIMTREEAIKLLYIEKSIIQEVDGNTGAEELKTAYDMAIQDMQDIENGKYIEMDEELENMLMV